MSFLLWCMLAALYLVMLFTLAITTMRKGHIVLFFVGIVFPVLWIVGALLPPTSAVATAESRSNAL